MRIKLHCVITCNWVNSGFLLVVPSVSTMTYFAAGVLLPRPATNTSLWSCSKPAAMSDPVCELRLSPRNTDRMSRRDVKLDTASDDNAAVVTVYMSNSMNKCMLLNIGFFWPVLRMLLNFSFQFSNFHICQCNFSVISVFWCFDVVGLLFTHF